MPIPVKLDLEAIEFRATVRSPGIPTGAYVSETLSMIERIRELRAALASSIEHHRMARDVAEAEGLFCGREEVNEETSWINGLVAILKKGDV